MADNNQGRVVVAGDRQRSQQDISINAARAAAGFSAIGVGPDDCIALMLRNDFAFFEASFAAAMLGAYATPVNWHYTAEEADYILRDCDAKVLVIHTDLLPTILPAVPDGVLVLAVPTPAEIAAAYQVTVPDTQSDRVADWDMWLAGQPIHTGTPPAERGTMIYTSGTTGWPKGVRREPMTEAAVEQNARMLKDGFDIAEDASDIRVLMNGPMYHSAPCAFGLSAVKNGAYTVLQPRFDAEDLLRLIDEHKITHMHVVPTMFVRLLRLPAEVRAKYDVSSLQFVIHGAAPCSPETKRGMIDWWGPVINEYYGSTENGIVTVADTEMALEKRGTVGRAICGNDIRVLGEDGTVLPTGEVGEIYVWRPVRTDFTYHKRQDDRDEIEASGYLTNGDMGWLDADGCLFLADRKKDMIISGGVNIYPAEIEKVLLQHPAIADCAVFGIPHEEFGESICAHIQPSGARPDIGELKTWLSEHLAKFKIPNVIEFADTLPREDSGKIFKRKLRDPYWASAGRQI